MATAHGAGVILAQVKEAVADALTSIAGQKHAFGAVEYMIERHAAACHRRAEIGGVILHRGAGGGPHKARAVERAHEDRVGAVAVDPEIAFLVVELAVIEIRKGVEHFDAQPRHIGQGGDKRRAGQPLDPDHAETWAIQSARL